MRRSGVRGPCRPTPSAGRGVSSGPDRDAPTLAAMGRAGGARKGIRLGLSWVRVCDACGLGATLAEVWCAPPTPTHPIRRPKAVDGRRPRCPIGRRRRAWQGPRMGIRLGLSWVRVCDVCGSGATLTEVWGVPPMPTYPVRQPRGVPSTAVQGASVDPPSTRLGLRRDLGYAPHP